MQVSNSTQSTTYRPNDLSNQTQVNNQPQGQTNSTTSSLSGGTVAPPQNTSVSGAYSQGRQSTLAETLRVDRGLRSDPEAQQAFHQLVRSDGYQGLDASQRRDVLAQVGSAPNAQTIQNLSDVVGSAGFQGLNIADKHAVLQDMRGASPEDQKFIAEQVKQAGSSSGSGGLGSTSGSSSGLDEEDGTSAGSDLSPYLRNSNGENSGLDGSGSPGGYGGGGAGGYGGGGAGGYGGGGAGGYGGGGGGYGGGGVGGVGRGGGGGGSGGASNIGGAGGPGGLDGMPQGSGTSSVSANAGSGQLPPLSANPSNEELKKFVSDTYDAFPQFKQVFEGKLGMTKDQAMAFMYADMSRESGKDGHWQMDLTTGDGSAHAWGPFQAAVTNFKGGGFDSSILNNTGLPIPDMKDFNDPATSTYAGMRRLVEGVTDAMQQLGPGQSPEVYLKGSWANHNTGNTKDVNNQNWENSYGDPTWRMMNAYMNHLNDEQVYVTGQG